MNVKEVNKWLTGSKLMIVLPVVLVKQYALFPVFLKKKTGKER